MVKVEITGKTLNEYYDLVRAAKKLGTIGQDFDFEFVNTAWSDDWTTHKPRHLVFYFYTEELAIVFKLKHD